MTDLISENHGVDFGVGEVLLELLHETGSITESRLSIITNSVMITENRQNTPTTFIHKEKIITWDQFRTIYTDYDTYPAVEDIWLGLGYPTRVFEPTIQGVKQTASANMRRALDRVYKHFQSLNKEARDILVKPSQRMKAYSNVYDSENEEYEIEDPTRDDINPGRRGVRNRSTQIIDRINSQDLLNGEFYSDFSRIPPSRWSSWLRFWDREKTSVKHDKALFGRTWKKTFVLGYQVEKNLSYEIWYNSLDSSFSVHDYRGNQMLRRFPTLSEAVKGIFNAIAQSSTQDKEFFVAMNNPIAMSIARTMVNSLDTHIDDLMAMDKQEQEEEKRKQLEAQAAKEKRKAEAAAAVQRAMKKREENMAHYRSLNAEKIDSFYDDVAKAEDESVRQAFSALEKFGNVVADGALKAFAEGKTSVEEFAKKAAGVYSLYNTPEEKEIRERHLGAKHDVSAYVAAVRELAAKKKADEILAATNKSKNATPPPPDPKKQKAKANAAAALAKYRDRNKKEEKIDEGFSWLMEHTDAYDAIEDVMDDAIDNRHYQTIKQIRKEAEGSTTQAAMKAAINDDLITTYDKTRVAELSTTAEKYFPTFMKMLGSWVNAGRSEPIVLPTDKRVKDKLRMALRGQRYSADFIIGLNLSNAVNLEIWYITEPNPSYSLSVFGGVSDGFAKNPTISTFYVFDITSGRLLRKYVPYYRNALQIAMSKLSAI